VYDPTFSAQMQKAFDFFTCRKQWIKHRIFRKCRKCDAFLPLLQTITATHKCESQMPRVIKGIMPSHVDALTHDGFNLRILRRFDQYFPASSASMRMGLQS